MTLWLLAAGLLASGPYHNARGYSGDARIDLGRVIPGHSYYYQAYFRNDTGVPLRLSGDLGCGTCPQLSVRGGKLAPGDSAELSFTGTVKKSLADSLWQDVRLYTDDGSRRGLWTYRFRFKAGKPSLVRARSRPVEVSANKEGYLEGAIKLTSLSGEPLLIRPVGMPHGVRYSPEAPVRLPPRGSIALTFRAPPEYFTRHRSITLEAVPAGGGRGERFSLPFAP
jgi:hypothetical protein